MLKVTYDPGIVILDVRTELEYRQGHITNAVLMNYDKNFEEKVKLLNKNSTS